MKIFLSQWSPYITSIIIGILLGVAMSGFAMGHWAQQINEGNSTLKNRISTLEQKLSEQTNYSHALTLQKNSPNLNADNEQDEVKQVTEHAETEKKLQVAAPLPAAIPEPIPRHQQTKTQNIRHKPPSPVNETSKKRSATPPVTPNLKIKKKPQSQATSSSALQYKLSQDYLEGIPIEAISSGKAGLQYIGENYVILATGLRIGIGQSFPSGEKLLFVDSSNGHLVTNQRQILLLN